MYRAFSFSFIVSMLILASACGKSEPDDKQAPAKKQVHQPSKVNQKTANQVKANSAKETAIKLTQGSADAGPRGDAKSGASIYATYCMACHQKDGKGMGGALAADFVNDTSRLAKPDSLLLSSIANGVKGKLVMPPQKDILSPQQQKDVLAYIRTAFSSKFTNSGSGG